MRVTPRILREYKLKSRPIVTLTAWDYAIARLVDQAGVDVILVGDSLAMVALGYENTLPVSLDAMIHHTQAVCRGVEHALVVSDLPFLTYQESMSQAIHTAGRILKETSAQAIKLEGGHPAIAATVDRLTMLGIPVMGHVGLTPQSVHTLGYRQQGKNEADATRVVSEAIALEQAGAFAIVLEHIPAALARTITEKLSIPTIGIGAGSHCDGQVLVTADVLGLSEKSPPFAKKYLQLDTLITEAIKHYSTDVRQRKFPASEAE
ncbi:MAG: 3-methyl-2-oxobutanoate hydroxymethyltransferase [Limnothrix sp. RL_2_0]|nr:3-methyl-2-oxobutanoate hydroxymethyltransferase [Limnothrix sp. RL_2_0]